MNMPRGEKRIYKMGETEMKKQQGLSKCPEHH
jgi:hypothetical protein